MNGQLPDERLARLRARDHEAFNDFVREHHGAVYRMAHRLLRHAEDALEVTQESFLAAYEGIARYEGRATLKTWLLSIAYRKTMDRMKVRYSESHTVSGVLDDDALWRIAQSVPRLTDWGIDPEQHYARGELSERLHEALARLTPETRSVFELRDLQGLSSRETADVLGISEGAVRVRLHRVRQYLVAELQLLFGGKGAQP